MLTKANVVVLDQHTDTTLYESFTFPHFRSKLQSLSGNGSVVALGAVAESEPIGLILAEIMFKTDQQITPELAWIHSLFVKPEHRRQGVGRALLCHLEGKLQQLGCPAVRLNYLASLKTRPLENLLNQSGGWSIENTGVICYASKAKVLSAPSPHLVDYIDRLTRALPPGYELFPWSQLTPGERAALEARIDTNPLYKKFNPFIEESIFEPINSVGLRHNSEVAGWMVNHRIAPDTIRYTQLFVDPDTQPLSRGLLILAESIRLLPEECYATFNFEPSNQNMVNMVQRRLKPYISEIRRSYTATKALL